MTRAKALLIRPDVDNPPIPTPLPKSFECRASQLTVGLMSTHMLPDCQSLVGRRQSLLESRPSGDLIVGRRIVARRTVALHDTGPRNGIRRERERERKQTKQNKTKNTQTRMSSKRRKEEVEQQKQHQQQD